MHPDPNLHLNGIKRQTGVGVRAGEFTVTLISHSAVEVRMVGAKGPDVAWGEIAGPICEEAIQLEAEKAVSPTVAQPGGVLTYIVSENVGTHWAYGIVLTDPIPAGTTYVGASAQATSGYVQYDTPHDLIRWRGDLAPGQTVTVTFMVWVHDTQHLPEVYDRCHEPGWV